MKCPHIAAALALLLLGCGGVYGPLYDPSRPSEAEYELRDESSKFGSAVVVADALADVDVGGKRRATITLRLSVDNTSDEEIEVLSREVELAWVLTTAGRVEGPAIEVLRRGVSVVGDEVAVVAAEFALPEGHVASQVRAFGVRWSFERGGERYGELTTFGVPSDRGGTSLATVRPVVLHSASTHGQTDALMGATDYYAPPIDSGAPADSSFPDSAPSHIPAEPSISVDRIPATPSVGD